jgi:PKD repeat protein
MRKIYSILIAIVLTGLQFNAWSQCNNCGSQYPTTTQSTTSSSFTTVSTCMYGGEYAVFNVTSGQTYTWQTCGNTAFDTQLTLQQGTGCAGADLAYNDDGCGMQSTITWTATFTGTVSVLVSQYNCTSNSTCMTLQWACTTCGGGGGTGCSGGPPCSATSPPASDFCNTAVPICEFEGYCGNTSATYTASQIPSGFCGSVENNSWLSFTASATTATLNIYVCNCTYSDGIQMEIYSTTDCVNFTSFSNCWNPGVQTNGTVTATGLTVGASYLLMIDGFAGDVCNYTISAGAGVWTATAIVTQTGTASASICLGQTVNLQASGGTSYSWTPTTGLSNPNIANPTATPTTTTTYTCNITGGNPLCPGTQQVQVTITVSPGLTVTTSATPPSCYNGTNGSAAVTSVTGGTTPYSYSWSGGGSTQTISPRPPGTYTVTVTSPNGCTAAATVVIPNPAQMTITASPTASTCGGSNGSIAVNVTAGGVANYTYACPPAANSTNNPSSSYNFTGLAAGNYTITVTNGNGCTATASATIATSGSATAGFTYNGNQCVNSNSYNFTNTGSTGGTYSWTFPSGTPSTSTAQNPTGVTWSTAGTYTVTQVVDLGGGCTATSTQTITVYARPNANITPTNVGCFGACNGSALVTGSGGSGTYTSYNWSNSYSGQNNTGLCPGTYTVTITDSYGCSNTNSTTITQPAALSVVTSRTDPTCNGGCNGTAQATVSGGSGSFSYAWSNLATGQNISGLCAGTYTVTVTDLTGGAGCTQTANVVLSNPPAIVLSGSAVNATCGAANGSATVTVTSGGTPNYTYNWSNGTSTPNSPSSSNTISAITSGTYTVTVTSSNGCTATTSINVNSTGAPTATITASTPPLCFGSCNGSATVSIGGTLNPPFNYVWSNGSTTNGSAATTNTVNTLCNGMASVNITDALGCVATANVNIVQPAQITTSTTTTNATCGQSNGTATVNAIGGTGAYSYLWNPGGNTTQTITNKPAGTYSVTVTDGNGCTAVASATINNTAGVVASISGTTQPACFGGSNGTATAQGTGGTLPYSYLWSTGAQTAQTAINLPSGSYTVTITDGSGCTSVATATVTQPTAVTAAISGSTPASCFGSCNGTATVTPGGGTAPYTYQWSNTQTIPGATGLCAGTYTVTVRDVNNCSATATVTITQPIAVNATTTSVNAHCNLPDGSATVNPTGGTSPYTYQWSGGGQVTQTAINLIPGSYSVTVTDSQGCTYIASATVGNIPAGSAVISNTTHVTCNGLCNGAITVSMSGGTTPYTYVWNPGGQTGITASGLCAGNYTVSVTDASGCVVTASSTVNQPTALSLNINSTNINCFGGCDGIMQAVPSGGTTPYTYQWSNTVFTANNPNLCQGSYSVTVSDANGCTITGNESLAPPPAMTLSPTIVSANCGMSDGSVSINITNGAPPFTYVWNPNLGTGPSLSNVPSGSYSVTVTDFKGCSATGTYIVPDASGVTATLGPKTNVTCFGLCNGTASVVASGGLPPYTYAWNDPFSQTTTTATNLCAGTYSVSVIDNNGCVASNSVVITQPTALTIANITGVSPLCNGNCNGTANVIVTGGSIPYTYLWSGGNPNGGANPTASLTTGICSGAMSVLVTDNNGCTVSGNTLINEPSFITLSTNIHHQSCSGANDGNIAVSVTGGIPPYNYQWGPSAGNQTSPTAYNLSGGTHSVTVTDANGCTATISGTVSTPNPLVFIATPVHVSCFLSNNGSITLNGSGGTPPYTFSWTNSVGSYSSSQQNIGNLPAETYSVTVTDANGCSTILSTIISQPPPFTLNLFKTDETCYQFCNGTITASVTGGQQPYSYLWSNLQTGTGLSNLCPGTYSVTVTDNNGCTVTGTQTIVGPPLLQLNLVSTTPATCGVNNGSAIVSVQGGTTGYSIQWSTGGNALFENNMPAGNHTVILIDYNGCADSMVVSIQNFNGPTITTVTPSHVTCAGLNNGVAIVNYSPSSPPAPPYTSTWSNGWVGDTATGLAGGLYYVTVVDANGCQSTGTIVINEPTQLVAVVNYVSSNPCFGDCSAIATSLTAGGTPPYTYNWLGIGQTGTSATGLCAGTYNLVVTDSRGCTTSSQAIVTQPGAINITGTVTDVTCYGNANGIVSINTTGGSAPHQFVWMPPATSTTSVAAYLAAGTYQVVVTDGNNCTATEFYTVNQPDQIAFTTAVTPAACGNAIGTAQVQNVTGGVPPYSYLWSPGNQTSPLITNLTNGIYQVQVSDFNGCVVQTSIPVGMVSGPQVIVFDISNVTCYGLNTGMAEANIVGGSAPFSFTWSNGQTDSIATNLMAGVYTVTVTDLNGCSLSSNVTVGQPQQIQVIPLGCDTICQNQSAIISATANGGTPPYEFFWSGPDIVNPNGQFQNISPLTTTNYSVYVVDVNGCVSTPPANITVNVYPSIFVTISPDALICEGQQHAIHVQASGGRPPYSYVWNIGSGNPNLVTPLDTTTYTVTVYDACSTTPATASMTIFVKGAPKLLNTPAYQSGCVPLAAQFSAALLVNDTNVTFLWNFGDPNSTSNTSTSQYTSHVYNFPGAYDVTLTLTDGQGCSTSYLLDNLVDVFPSPNADFIATPQQTDVFHSTITFYDQSNLASQWLWYFGDGQVATSINPVHTYDLAGTYEVTLLVRSANGCLDSAKLNITIQEAHTFYAPNAFTPANGFTNNYFYPKGLGIDAEEYQLTILDRWGQLIFNTDKYPIGTSQVQIVEGGWNGRYNNTGDFVPIGTYVWQVKCRDVNGIYHEYTGVVTVVR